LIRELFEQEARRVRRAFLFVALVLLTSACGCTTDAPRYIPLGIDTSGGRYSPARLAGSVNNNAIRETSGLARSGGNSDRLWLLNDGGSPSVLHAIGLDGSYQHGSRLPAARNRDWEDLAAFSVNGRHWLLIADVGDNGGRRDFVTLYVVEEPGSTSDLDVTRQIRVTFPDGPRDCEAVAVDPLNQSILLLSKRSIPAVLYTIPLLAEAHDKPLVAERMGSVTSIPQPTTQDLERALPDKSWHWQPTAMDISQDGATAVILTYRAAYVFDRSSNESWIAALQRQPVRLDLGGLELAESVAFSNDGSSIYITAEGHNPPLIRFDKN